MALQSQTKELQNHIFSSCLNTPMGQVFDNAMVKLQFCIHDYDLSTLVTSGTTHFKP